MENILNSKNLKPITELGTAFYDVVPPATFPTHQLRFFNFEAAKLIGLETLSQESIINHFGKFQPLDQNLAQPLALRYHGHQFHSYNPQLGDGRGFLFAQFQTANTLYDLGTKGSGQTPYSRGGDGRLTLKGAVREILATEFLHAHGVNTSRTFCVIETGESLSRNDEPSPTRAAVLTRLSKSHIRFGTFQRLAHLKESENIQKLLKYCVKYYYPELAQENAVGSDVNLAQIFFNSVARAQAQTVAQWMAVGFVHGVLNTDNMNITGESFDYGPYRFLPTYDPHFTAAYFDHTGLYSYGRQPWAVAWNLNRLGQALQVAYPDLDIDSTLEHYGEEFNSHLQGNLLRRLNLKPLSSASTEGAESGKNNSKNLVACLFDFLEKSQAPFEQVFFDLHSGAIAERLKNSPVSQVYTGEYFETLLQEISKFEARDERIHTNAYYTRKEPLHLKIEIIEALWESIAQKDDWQPLHNFLAELKRL